MNEHTKWAIGIDGGGTKSTACLIDSEGILLGRMEFAATNYSKSAAVNIVDTIQEAVGQLLQSAKINIRKPAVLSVCLSGLGRGNACQHVKQLLIEKKIAPQTVTDSDAMAALYGAFAGREGIIIIAGTGSIALGKSQSGELIRCGGWGYLLGDEGSGFDIGRNGIAAALKAWDGRGPATSLRNRFEKHFRVASIDQAVTAIYTDYTTRGALAQFAPVVFEEAAKGDIAALEILKTASMDLAQLVVTIAKKMATNGRIPVALMGKIFKNERLKKDIQMNWQKKSAQIKVVEPVFPADIGAALLGLEKIGVKLTQNAEKRLTVKL